MKKKLLLLILSVLALAALSGCNARDSVEDGCFKYGHVRFPESYFADCYYWDGNADTMEIFIPDEYNGVKIKQVGGYFGKGAPAPFTVILPENLSVQGDDTFTTEDERLVTDTDYITYSFTIHIGKNVKEFYGMSDSYYGTGLDSDEDIVYKIEYNYVIDGENPYLQLVDGEVVSTK